MDPTKNSAIDLVEAAYNLELGPVDWLPNLIRRGGPILDLGSGCAAAIWAGASDAGEPLIAQMHVESAPPDLAIRFARAAQEVESDVPERTSEARAGGVHTLSESKERCPNVYNALTRHVGCRDILGLWAIDPNLHGVGINIPSSEVIDLRCKAREHWQMLAVHIAAGHRLRRGLGQATGVPCTPVTQIPLNAEAVLDPKRFLVSEAAGQAKDKAASELIREAAIRLDRARGRLRGTDPCEALRLWQGLVRGRWSLVDWFDTDGRRYVVAKANAPQIGDPRGLTDREHQVATYAALGETGKITGYRLGLSPARVSTLLTAAMRKLGVRSKAQLVIRMRVLQGVERGHGQDDPQGNAA